MNRIRNKLRSQMGASITFALLLFLVCTVLCSVILTAATASSGRMSQIAESDQRYYAVTSAAELMKDIIDGKTASIIKKEVVTTETTYSGGSIKDTKEESTATVNYIVEGELTGDIDDYCVEANSVDKFEKDTILKDAAYAIYNNGSTSVEKILDDKKLTAVSNFYNAEDLGLDYDVLAVTMLEDLDQYGNITLQIYNTYKGKKQTSSAGDQYKMQTSSAGDQYKMTILFGADQNETTDTRTENVSSSAGGDTEYVVKTNTTIITVTSLTWNLTEIKTNSGGE